MRTDALSQGQSGRDVDQSPALTAEVRKREALHVHFFYNLTAWTGTKVLMIFTYIAQKYFNTRHFLNWNSRPRVL